MARGLLVTATMLVRHSTLRSVAIALTVLATTHARAEPEPQPEGRVGLGMRLGGLFEVGGIGVEIDAAWRPAGDSWLRAAVTGVVPFPNSGRILEARLGFEHRRRDCGRGCFHGGIDLALVAAHVRDDPDETTTRAVLAVPRAGIDVGSDVLRFRLCVEGMLGGARVRDRQPEHVPPVDTTTTRFVTGLVFTIGVSAQF